MGEQVSVAELAKRENTTPQVVNMWVTKRNLPTVEGVTPRRIDLDVFQEWLGTQVEHKRERKEQAKETAQARKQGKLPPKASAIHVMTVQERQMLAWSRGEGRGWALGMPADKTQPFVDDCISLVNHIGREHVTTERRLLQEAKEGKLFFMDPCEVVAFLAGQLDPVTAQDDNFELRRAVGLLYNAAEALTLWKVARHGMTAEDREAVLEEGARVVAAHEAEAEEIQ